MNRFWAGWVIVGIVAEFATLATGTPTLSQAWRTARETWPTWASMALSIVTVALGVWILGSHWVWSRYDLPGRTDDLILGLLGAFIGFLGWRNWHKHELPGGLQPNERADTGSEPRSEDAS